MSVDVTTGDPGLEIDHAADVSPLQRDIVKGNGGPFGAVRRRDFRVELQPRFPGVVAVQNLPETIVAISE